MALQAPGVIGSVLGLAGPVTACCDWARWRVGCNFYLSVANPSLRYTYMLLERNKQQLKMTILYLEFCGGMVHDGEAGEAVGTRQGRHQVLTIAVQRCPRLTGKLCILVRRHHHCTNVGQ